MTDIWICAACRSVNRQRDDRCYKCGARQEQALATGGPGLRVETALAERQVRGYRPAWMFGFVAAALILVVAALGVYLALEERTTIEVAKSAFAAEIAGSGQTVDAALTADTERLATPIVARVALLFLAVVAFGVWLSRVVMNIPALGGGTPGTTPVKALVYPMIPVLNLVKVPGMVQDVLYRVEPKAGGFFMVAIAWFGLVGSWLISYVVSRWIIVSGVSSVLAATEEADVVAAFNTVADRLFALDVATAVMVAGGALFLVFVMIRVESRSAARDREIRAALPA